MKSEQPDSANEVSENLGLDLCPSEWLFELDQRPSFVNFSLLNSLEIPFDVNHELLKGLPLEHAQRELTPIHSICRAFGYRPLISEFALINDKQLIGPEPEVAPYFTSFISSFLPDSMEVVEAYARTLKSMSDEEMGKTQIVPHPGLYSPTLGWMQRHFSNQETKHRNDEPDATTSIMANDKPVVAATRQRFTLIPEPQFGLSRQVSKFLDRFRVELRACAHAGDSTSLFNGCLFILLPVVRPGFESAALPNQNGNRNEGYKGYPAGALFLFVKPDNVTSTVKKEKGPAKDFARALSLLLAESSLWESYASLQVEEKRKRAFASYSLTHNLKQRLGLLSASTQYLIRSFENKEVDFPIRLNFLAGLVDYIYKFAELAHLLHFAAQHGADAALRELESGGKPKFSRTTPLDLKRLLTQAVKNEGLRKDISRNIQLRFPREISPIVHGFHMVDSIQKRVRLKDEAYMEILYEVVANLAKHGFWDRDNNCVMADIEITLVGELPALVVSNDVSEQNAQKNLYDPIDQWKEWSGGATGLMFIRDCLKITDAGRIWVKHPRTADGARRRFSIALELKGLSNVSAT